MSIQEFREAVANAKQRPKGVKVSRELFRLLQDEGAIEVKPFTLWGLPTETFQFDLPAFNGDIYVHEDAALEGLGFCLPPSSL